MSLPPAIMTTIQIRTNEKIKASAQQILGKLGLDLSTAINMYLVQIIEKKGIPFEILTKNGLTAAQEKEILKEIEWTKTHGKSYSSARELHKDILAS
ncbi:MAG: translation repressor RelB [Candidatus Peribacteria bacterium]|nr:translation repressor RelB [Candidatus Peribacteria bacterium]